MNKQLLSTVYTSTYLPQKREQLFPNQEIQKQIQAYGTSNWTENMIQIKEKLQAKDIILSNYTEESILEQDNSQNQILIQKDGFISNLSFWNDLILIGEKLKNAQPQYIALRHFLQIINKQLPSAVYIPFVWKSIRHYNILNIVVEETKLFSSKERSPFSICCEVYRPEESFFHEIENLFQEQEIDNYLSFPFTTNREAREEDNPFCKQSCCFENKGEYFQNSSFIKENIEHYTNRKINIDLEQRQKQIEEQKHNQLQKQDEIISQNKEKNIQQLIFGEDFIKKEERIRENSPFGNLKTWKLIEIIVKNEENIKMEQFATQLIYQFHQIFKKQKLPLSLFPYEIVSLSQQAGILQMVPNAVTFDHLKRTMWQDFPQKNNFGDFFDIIFPSQNLQSAKYNFLHSLCAYSLVCYFLQIKDRHNGNIMLHKSGHIVHIDFGFFLSSAPGKGGVHIEKKLPFKLISEYLEILGGVDGQLFGLFRKLFFKGFQAAQKHQDEILILVNMMYEGEGSNMQCFQKGETCIQELYQRFNPQGISNDGDLNVFCNNLINQSLDNWRTKWYDKYQYFCSGIFY
ncbi:phosphatidylinositol 4-kinase, putative [Ichthyophthirius multifiliis]|uniref:1-phosphatidylinositol 4-kinase n=1 Tax=Ichthyophthirius multifiliis TaxID=5932 RepID=G0QJ18_ICHMU|nr:phosphatidylinositol 4-kinase, putative [Ichthyophthirius multifiliis]EGR34783.1 phosphatidylinositol 4-kinase, putative [Ichthyophthirius multifiliis]|eukprot:XP_004040087.1 phosphatidylinositol 4-kinase, putative [Ichthyophthirius multifiliis]